MLRFLLFVYVVAFLIPIQSLAHSQTQVVEMTKDGFVPTSVTIDTDSTVIFINKDNQAHWPASNPHPTHELFPEFDPVRPIQPNESWPFKPTKKGDWKFHDHLYPHFRGELIVTAEADTQPVQDQISSKKNSILESITAFFTNILKILKKAKPADNYKSPDAQSFIKLPATQQFLILEEISDHQGADKAWQFVKDTFKEQSGASGNIHDLAHLAGKLIYEKLNFAGVKLCSADFAFGCFHGFLDQAFAKNLDRLSDAQAACAKLGSENSGPVASCIHGIGHGVASFYSVNDLKKSLNACRKLISGQQYCFDGVFMEFVRSSPDSFFKKDDLLYPCDLLEKEFGYAYSSACGRNQPALLMSRFKIGFDEVINVCLSSSSTPFKQSCIDALGFSLAVAPDPQQIIKSCQTIGSNEYVMRCLQAAAGELVFQEVPNWDEGSQAVCQASAEADKCLEYVNRLVSEYHRVRKINFSPPLEEDINSYLRKQLKICYQIDGRDGCYKQVAQVLYHNFGLSKTLYLLKTNEQYPEVYARCHEVTHYLSRLEFDKQQDIAKVYAQCDSTCHGGCYHGTMEAYLKQKNLTGEQLKEEFAKVCGKAEDYQKPIEFNECLHGLGHAAMFVLDMELKESLKLCDSLDSQEHKERCYTGAFMENSSSSTSFDHSSIYIKADDPFYPCNALEEKYLSLCWQYQSSYFSIINKQDWSKVSKMCLQIPSQYQDRCFKTIGTNQVGFTSSLNTMKQDCDLMPSAHFQNVCVAGVVSSLSYRFVGDLQKMVDFCSLVNTSDKEICFKQIGTSILDWNKDKSLAKQSCGQIKDQRGSLWCLSVM